MKGRSGCNIGHPTDCQVWFNTTGKAGVFTTPCASLPVPVHRYSRCICTTNSVEEDNLPDEEDDHTVKSTPGAILPY